MIVSFLGADHKCGCSMTALCTAETLAQILPDKKVVLVKGCSGPEPLASGESVERLRPFLAGKNPDMEEIIEKSRLNDNLHVISGLVTPGLTATVHPDMSAYLAENLGKRFDFVVCDCGCDLEQGLPLGLLLASDSVYMVLDHHEAAIRRIEWLMPLYRRLELAVAGWILCGNTSKGFYSRSDIEIRLGLEKGSIIPIRHSDSGEAADARGKSLLTFKDKGYRKDISALAGIIAASYSDIREAQNGKL